MYEKSTDVGFKSTEPKVGFRQHTANGSNCLVVVPGLGLVLLAAPGAAMHGRKTNRSPDWSGPPSWSGFECMRIAYRPDRTKGWCYTMCSMCKCARKDTVSRTTCACRALDGLSGFVTYGKSRMGVLEFRTLGLPLVAPSNPRGCSRDSHRHAPVQRTRCLVRVACS